MITVGRIMKDYRQSGAFNALVGIHAALDDGIFATKSGELVTWLALQGIDCECKDPDDIDQVARRFESVQRVFDERFRIQQYIFKREEPDLPRRHYSDPVVEEAVGSRVRYLANKSEKLCGTENYLAITYEGWQPNDRRARLGDYLRDPKESLRRLFSERETNSYLRQELTTVQEFFANKVASFAIQLSDFLRVERLSSQQGFTVLRRLLNYAPFKGNVRLNHPTFVDFQACDSSLECHQDYLRLDDYFVQVLTLKELPSRTFAHLLRGATELPPNFIISSEWKREPVHKVRSLIQSKRRHFHNSKASLMNYLNSSGNGVPHDVLIDDGAAAVVRTLGGSLEEIEVQGRHFGQFSLTLILYHKDLSILRRSVAQAFKVFATHDAQLTEEHYNRLNAWLAVPPGQSAYNLRRLWLTNTNYADLSFLFTPDSGQAHNEHLGQEYLAILEGVGGTLYFFNLHSKDVAHTLVLGPTGVGKSFLLNFTTTHLQKYDPITLIFDLGGSYKSLTRLFNGVYVEIGKPGRSFTINPFCLEPTRENLLFLFSFLKVLIESHGYRTSAAEEKDLYEQIENLYQVAPDQRRLFTLANILPRTLRDQLQKWVEGGPYASLFDNVEDQLHLARFQTFDFEGMDKAPGQLEALLFYVLHRASAVINEAPLSQFKVLIIDEAWRFFRHPVIRAYIEESLKTWRKKNAAVVMATQSGEDLLTSEMLPVVVEGCPTTIFLANPGMDREAYARLFHLNDTETEVIARLVPKHQFLLKQPGLSKVLSLNVDRKEYWIYTSNPREAEQRASAFERYGFQKGLEILARENV